MNLSEKAQASLNKVIEKFQTGDLSPIVKAVQLQLDPDAPALKWSLGNQVLAVAQTGTLDCRGYRQWQEANRHVKKGALAAYILSPVTVKKEKDTGDEYRQCIGFKPTPIFSIEDTDGDPLPATTPPAQLPPWRIWPGVWALKLNTCPWLALMGIVTSPATQSGWLPTMKQSFFTNWPTPPTPGWKS
jgi:hypothetical protein